MKRASISSGLDSSGPEKQGLAVQLVRDQGFGHRAALRRLNERR